jgi:hypothetical protein
MQGKGVVRGAIGAGAVACALAFAGGGTASGAPGDTFYLGKKSGDHVLVSFVVRADSNEVSQLLWGVRNVPCKGHRAPPKPQSFINLPAPPGMEVPIPIVDGTFKEPFASSSPKFGGIKGTADEGGFSGTARIIFHIKRKGGTDATCKSGRREWNARPVSEERWNASRENYVPSSPPR